jgi:hypothetical protein
VLYHTYNVTQTYNNDRHEATYSVENSIFSITRYATSEPYTEWISKISQLSFSLCFGAGD